MNPDRVSFLRALQLVRIRARFASMILLPNFHNSFATLIKSLLSEARICRQGPDGNSEMLEISTRIDKRESHAWTLSMLAHRC
jgi:hypothetical protein